MDMAVVGRIPKHVLKLKKQVRHLGYRINSKNPDIILSLGGDGTFLYAERKYPSIPKMLLRDSSICNKCNEGILQDLLNNLVQKKYRIIKYNKLEVIVRKKRKKYFKLAVNDVVIRNYKPYNALRFKLKVDKKYISSELIGDGIVVATPFGSTSYFQSITRTSFKVGIGIAFNNLTLDKKPIIRTNLKTVMKILRNKATLSVDNDEKVIIIDEKDSVIVKKSTKTFKIISIR